MACSTFPVCLELVGLKNKLTRHRVHEYNTSFLLTTFLPYHSLPLFKTLLSIIPTKLPTAYKFLFPYVRSLTNPPRHTVVYTATNNHEFAALLNSYVLNICNQGQHYPALLSFWAGIMTEAVAGMLDKSRSGIKGVQLQNEQDVVLRLSPTLNDGLAARSIPDLQVGCYMILAIMASKGGLEDKLLMAMMDAVVSGWSSETHTPGLVCLAILAQRRVAKEFPGRLVKGLMKVDELPERLKAISNQHRVERLANGLSLALVRRLAKTGEARTLPIVQQIIADRLVTDAQSTTIVKSCVLAAYQLNDENDAEGTARAQLARSLTSLAHVDSPVGFLVRKAIEGTEIDIDELEMRLSAVLRPKLLTAAVDEDEKMEDASALVTKSAVPFEELVANLSTRKVGASFLADDATEVFDELCQAFIACLSESRDVGAFTDITLLKSKSALGEWNFFTFFARAWCSPLPVLCRAMALQAVTRRLNESNGSNVDLQNLLPYAIVALSDPATKVRRAASELLLAIGPTYPTDVKKQILKIWATKNLYGGSAADIKALSASDAAQLVKDVLLTSLEECVLDKNHITSIIDSTLNSSKTVVGSPKKGEVPSLKQNTRLAILCFLASHAYSTPVLLVKLRLLKSLNLVRGVASTTRTKVLLPVLKEWSDSREDVIDQKCSREQIDISELDREMVKIVIPTDESGLSFFESVIKAKTGDSRPQLIAAIFKRYQEIWSSLKGQHGIDAALMMMQVAQSAGKPGSNFETQAQAMQLLRTVPLSSDVLVTFLEDLPTAAKLADDAPATKRRRVSHGQAAKMHVQDTGVLEGAIQKVTFVLQLIDSSEPEKHPALLRGLFNALAELQHFKAQVGSELGYLQGLALSSLLSIMGTYKSNKTLKIDRSAVRADLLVDCVQKTSSPQVQNAALLLIASLSETAPELVLHSVMPIFTFMGNSVLRQNDEYSAHVIKQTISEVIPPLIESLRTEKGNPVTGAAELLLSFVAAYEHVPAHRRKGLFTSLVQTLGADDFLFALLAMLADKYGSSQDIKTFSAELSSSFGVDIQLQSAIKYLDLVEDVLKPKPVTASTLLNAGDFAAKEPQQTALNLLELLPAILSYRRLVSQTTKLLEKDDMDASRVREVYATLLEQLLVLADTFKAEKDLHSACGDVLGALLGLLSTSEFVKSVESLLDRPNAELRRKILRSLELRITQENQFNVVARQAMLSFLPQLTAIIRESDDILYKHTAVSCVDKIAEKYGKMDREAVAAAAETIAGEHCLGQADPRLRLMAVLCLTSLIDVLREGIVSVLPTATPKILAYMSESIGDAGDEALHNATYGFVSALLEHLPYMVSGANISELLSISNQSAEEDLEEETHESRERCLRVAAKQIDAKVMFTALENNWDVASRAGPESVREYLTILSTAIERHTKANITKHSSILSQIFLKAFDLRRTWQAFDNVTAEEVDELEALTNEIAIKMIYKLNDSTFRPIFAKIVEWAASGLPKKDKQGRTLRLQSLYAFMTVFFENLKSIVTSYSTYFLESVVDVLQHVDTKDDESKKLWSRALNMLVQSFSHDQDDFWQSPAHFDAIAPVLVSQFLHAPAMDVEASLIPAIVELAAAADSPDHSKELNGSILKHMRSESASIRLAAIKCQQALTDRLSEDWLGMLPEMLPFISEAQEDDDEVVEKETHRWIVKIEGVLGESLDSMLQ